LPALIPIGLSGRRRLIFRGLAAGCPRLGIIVGLPANFQPLGVIGRFLVGLLGLVELVRLLFDIGLVGLTAAGFIGLIPAGLVGLRPVGLVGFFGVGFIVLSVVAPVERMVALVSFSLLGFVVAAFVIVDLGVVFFGVRIGAGLRNGGALLSVVGLTSIRLELDPLSCRAVPFSIRPLPVVLVSPGRSV